MPAHHSADRAVLSDSAAEQRAGVPGVPPIDRRTALARLAGVALAAAGGGLVLGKLGGCASGASTDRRVTGLPSPKWPSADQHAGSPTSSPAPNSHHPSTRPLPTDPAAPGTAEGVIPRTVWSKGDPFFANMTRMQPIHRITLHHDGMTAFTATSAHSAAERIEAIRRAHRAMPGWGDIGYHYVIDPAGRVWEARPISWQGAHVKDQNPGNIGICLLGNYELQRPTDTQLAALERFVGAQMRQHRISLRDVRTHKEMAPTACPGRNLQPSLEAMRSWRGTLASA